MRRGNNYSGARWAFSDRPRRTPTTKMPLGLCPACRSHAAVKKDGALRKHHRWDLGTWHAQPCAGSGMEPVKVEPLACELCHQVAGHAPTCITRVAEAAERLLGQEGEQ